MRPVPGLRRTAFGSVLLAAGVFASACASGSGDFGGSSASTEMDVYETVIRWVHANYRPSRTNGYPAMWCLATGRFAARAVDRTRRDEGERFVPSPRLLDRVADLDPPVRAVTACHQSDELQEFAGAGGPPAALLLIDRPIYETSDAVRLRFRTRENAVWDFVSDCRIFLQNSAWRIRECV